MSFFKSKKQLCTACGCDTFFDGHCTYCGNKFTTSQSLPKPVQARPHPKPAQGLSLPKPAQGATMPNPAQLAALYKLVQANAKVPEAKGPPTKMPAPLSKPPTKEPPAKKGIRPSSQQASPGCFGRSLGFGFFFFFLTLWAHVFDAIMRSFLTVEHHVRTYDDLGAGPTLAISAFFVAVFSGKRFLRRMIALAIMTITCLTLFAKPLLAPITWCYKETCHTFGYDSETHMFFWVPALVLAPLAWGFFVPFVRRLAGRK